MAGSRVGLTCCNFMTAYNFKRSGLSYVAAGAADGDAETAGRRTTCGGHNDGGAATAAAAAGAADGDAEAAGRRTTGGGPNDGGAATAAAAAGAADGDAEAAGRTATGTIHDFRRNG